jgi:hypothetical protein
MLISCSDQNVQEATKLLGLNVHNRPNWEVPKLYDTYFVIRLPIFLDGKNCIACRHSIMTYYSCNIYVNQPDTQRFMIEFIHNTWRLDLFRTSVVHPQERLQAVCCKFGMW